MPSSNLSAALRSIAVATMLAAAPQGFAAPAACTCKDLPAMVKEIIEQEFLGNKFREWSGYMPYGFSRPSHLQNQAQKDFDKEFNSDKGEGAVTGTTDGGHAAMGTDYDSESCGIVEYQYNDAGKPVNKKGQVVVELDAAGKPPEGVTPPKDNEHYAKPVTEKQYMKEGKQCDALVRYAWIHELHHQSTCKRLQAENKTHLWKSMEFFAKNDAEAYKAGTDYLREQTSKLAKQCGWEGSTNPNAVPTPDRAKELADKGAKISKNRSGGGGKKKSKKGANRANIIVGATVDTSPMNELLARWDTQCQDDAAPGCGALGVSIEAGLVTLLQQLQRGSGVDRSTLFDAAQATLPQLKQLAMFYLYNAQSPAEVDFALEMTQHAAPGIREAARRMLQGSDDPRWKKIEPLWKSPRDTGTGSLVPDLEPRPEVFGLKSFNGLTYRPYGRSETQLLFTSTEPPEAVVKRVFKDKQVMTNAEELERNMEGMEEAMMKIQAEMMAAAQSGNMAKMTELSNKMMAMQQQLMPADPMAVNSEKGTIGILLEKDTQSGLPRKVAQIRRDEATAQTLVIFETTPQH